jgi:hypothetical protein
MAKRRINRAETHDIMQAAAKVGKNVRWEVVSQFEFRRPS